MDRKKLIRVAATRSRPRNSPPEIVAPDRETPGTRESTCTHPMTTASRMVSCFSLRFCVATRSANHITALQAIRATPTTHSERSPPVITSLNRRPATPTGMLPTMTYQPIRWSRWPRHSALNSPRNQAVAMRQMSRAK